MTIIPLREIYDVPAPPPPRYTTAAHPANVIKSASRPSVVRIARSSKKLAPIPGGELPQPPPPLELPRQILHNYRGERGTFFLFSLESWPSLETVVSDNLWQKASAETWTISCKERNRGERGNPVSIAPVTNVVKDRYESSLASNTKSGERGRGGERGNSAANFLTAPIFCERTLDLP